MVIGACHAYTPDMGSVKGEDQSVPKTIMKAPWSSNVVVATVILCGVLLAARVNAKVTVVVSAPEPTTESGSASAEDQLERREWGEGGGQDGESTVDVRR